MSWNYRVVIADKGTEEEWWSIREVYYNDDGEICGMTKDAVGVVGIDKGEVTWDLLNMLNALYDDPIEINDDFVFADWGFDITKGE